MRGATTRSRSCPRTRARVVLVATNPLAHRRILYSGFLDTALEQYDVEIWSAGGESAAGEFADREGLSTRTVPEVQTRPRGNTRYLRRRSDISSDSRL